MQLKKWLQNTVAKWFLPDFSFKGGSALDCRALWIFHFNVDQNSVAEHYEIDFDMIFRLNAAQNLVIKHYIIEFYMIYHFINAAQNLVAEHYERDFDLIFRLKAEQKLFVEQCEWDFYMIFHFKEAQHLVAEGSFHRDGRYGRKPLLSVPDAVAWIVCKQEWLFFYGSCRDE